MNSQAFKAYVVADVAFHETGGLEIDAITLLDPTPIVFGFQPA
jgi:hypothetical protein